MKVRSRGWVVFAVLSLSAVLLPVCARRSTVPAIVVAADASWAERTAAAELQRYFYVRTGLLPAVREVGSSARVPAGAVAVVVKGGALAGRIGGRDEAAGPSWSREGAGPASSTGPTSSSRRSASGSPWKATSFPTV